MTKKAWNSQQLDKSRSVEGDLHAWHYQILRFEKKYIQQPTIQPNLPKNVIYFAKQKIIKNIEDALSYFFHLRFITHMQSNSCFQEFILAQNL